MEVLLHHGELSTFPKQVQFGSYVELDRTGEWAEKARKAIALARLSLVKAAG